MPARPCADSTPDLCARLPGHPRWRTGSLTTPPGRSPRSSTRWLAPAGCPAAVMAALARGMAGRFAVPPAHCAAPAGRFGVRMEGGCTAGCTLAKGANACGVPGGRHNPDPPGIFPGGGPQRGGREPGPRAGGFLRVLRICWCYRWPWEAGPAVGGVSRPASTGPALGSGRARLRRDPVHRAAVQAMNTATATNWHVAAAQTKA
jgi:hypothetical protein